MNQINQADELQDNRRRHKVWIRVWKVVEYNNVNFTEINPNVYNTIFAFYLNRDLRVVHEGVIKRNKNEANRENDDKNAFHSELYEFCFPYFRGCT